MRRRQASICLLQLILPHLYPQMLSFSSSLPDNGYEISGRSRSSFYQPAPQEMPPEHGQGEAERKEIDRGHHRHPLVSPRASAFTFRAFCRGSLAIHRPAAPQMDMPHLPAPLHKAIQ